MEHQITPPPELVEEWFMDQRGLSEASRQHITTAAARWGADQELDACCEWLPKYCPWDADQLRAARRPKPPEPPTVMEILAARPLLERVARLGDCIGANTVGEIMAISSRAAAWLEANPPGQPVAIEPRGCPTPGACSCVEPATPPPEPPTSQITFNAPSPPEEVIRLDKEGFHYKGQFVADAGEAHQLMMAFFEQNTKTKPEPPTDEELNALWIEQYGYTGNLPAMSISDFKPAARTVLERWGHG